MAEHFPLLLAAAPLKRYPNRKLLSASINFPLLLAAAPLKLPWLGEGVGVDGYFPLLLAAAPLKQLALVAQEPPPLIFRCF